MPLTGNRKQKLGITDLLSYTMASKNSMKSQLEAFEAKFDTKH